MHNVGGIASVSESKASPPLTMYSSSKAPSPKGLILHQPPKCHPLGPSAQMCGSVEDITHPNQHALASFLRSVCSVYKNVRENAAFKRINNKSITKNKRLTVASQCSHNYIVQ